MSGVIENPLDDPPLLTLTARPHPDVVVVALAGELDMLTTPGITAALRHAAASGPALLALDLTDVEFIGSHGVSMLVSTLNEVGGAERMRLVGVAGNRRVRRVLELTGVSGLFAQHADVEELVANLADGGNPDGGNPDGDRRT